MVGSGIGGLQTIYEGSVLISQGKARRLSPFFIPSALINLGSGHLSIKYGFKGPNHSAVTACATGVHAIGDAARLIMWGDADVMVAGGAEAAVCELGIAGFCASRALSTGFNDRPPEASRPWDKDRDGFVMGEGAGVLVLEELEHARKRGAKIYAEVAGYGMSGDAFHITAPAEGHDGAFRSMKAAMQEWRHRAGRDPVRQRARHLHAAGRRPGAGGGGADVRRRRQGSGDVVHQVGDRASAGRGRRGRGDLLDPGDPRQRGSADPEPGRAEQGERDRPGGEDGAGAADQPGAVQQLRLRRHQRLGHLPRCLTRPHAESLDKSPNAAPPVSSPRSRNACRGSPRGDDAGGANLAALAPPPAMPDAARAWLSPRGLARAGGDAGAAWHARTHAAAAGRARAADHARRRAAAAASLWRLAGIGALAVRPAVAGGYAGLRHRLDRPGPLTITLAVVVPHGDTAEVGKALRAAGVIDSERLFRLAAWLTRRDGQLHAAELAFPAHASLREVLAVLRTAKPVEHRLTIPEGLTAVQIAALVQHAEAATGTVAPPPEGSVLPQTYSYEYGTPRGVLLARGEAAMDQALAAAWAEPGAGPAAGEPAGRADPRQHRRAGNGVAGGAAARCGGISQPPAAWACGWMPIRPWPMRPAAAAGVLDHKLTRGDLEQDDPFNTYRRAGLPPTPIDSPGMASILAVLHPAASDDLYFVADGSGGHVFARTLEAQNRNVARARAR